MVGLRWSVFMAGILIAAAARAESLAHYSVLQGVTDETNVEFSIVYPTQDRLQFQVHNGSRILNPSKMKISTRPYSRYSAALVTFQGLDPKSAGLLWLKNSQGQLLEARPFRLLDRSRAKVRLAFVSCAAGYLYRSSMWNELNRANPDLIVLLGDNVYADRPNWFTKKAADPEQLWLQYVEARLYYDLYRRWELIPTLAIWDDHDFGADEGDEYFPYAKESFETFKEFWPQEEGVSPSLRHGPGVAMAFDAFGMQFLLLDDRLFRTPLNAPPNSRTTWGSEEKKWIESEYLASNRPAWLINGQQFFGGYHSGDNVEAEYPEDLNWLIGLLRNWNRPVAFVGGDVHYSELMDIEPEVFGRPAVEITSSSIHSITLPGQHLRHYNPRRRAATSWHNFVVTDVEVHGDHVRGVATSIGAWGTALFKEPFQF